MYSAHQPIIGRYAQSPEGLARIMQFVILSARQPLHRVPTDIQTVQANENAQDVMGILFGWKYGAYQSAWDNRQTHFDYCQHILTSDDTELEKTGQLLEYFCELPGFWLAKAGFVLQLAFGLCGCLDTHNLKLQGFEPRAFRDYKLVRAGKARSIKSKRKMIALYLDAIDKAGGTQALWDAWCEHVAKLYPDIYRDAYHVSLIHLEALGLSRGS